MHEAKEESDEEEGQRYAHFLTMLHVHFKTLFRWGSVYVDPMLDFLVELP